MYEDKFRPLDAGDYTPPPVSGAVAKWCSSGELNTVSVDDDVRDYVQSRVDAGGNYAAFRLQFNENESDNWNDNDALVFNAMKLLVKYKAP